MKPLPRENTIWEFLRAHIFMIFGTCFTVSSRIHILSIFYRILSVLGLHFGTLGTTFGGHFFRSRKTPEVFLPCAPGGRPSSTPQGEGGNWEASGRHQVPGRPLGITLGTPLPPDLKKPQKNHFFGPHFRRYSEHICHVF